MKGSHGLYGGIKLPTLCPMLNCQYYERQRMETILGILILIVLVGIGPAVISYFFQ